MERGAGDRRARPCSTRRQSDQLPRGDQRCRLRLRRHLHWWPTGRNQMQCFGRTHYAAVMVTIIALALAGADAWSQSSRTIKVILPFAPGGPAYNAIRILGQQITANGGPTIVVEPHPGAGPAIGTEL